MLITTAVTSGVGHLLYTVLLPWLPDILSYLEDALLSGYQTIVSV